MGSQLKAHFKPTKSTCICTIHFCEEVFVLNPKDSSGRPLKKRKLKDGAVPTLFMVPEPTPKTRLNFQADYKNSIALEFNKEDIQSEANASYTTKCCSIFKPVIANMSF